MAYTDKDVQRIRHDAQHHADGLGRLDALKEGMGFWTELLWEAVRLARKQKYSWADIGETLGISAQAAHRRFRSGFRVATVTDPPQSGTGKRLTWKRGSATN